MGISASVTMEYIKAMKSTTKKRKAKNNKAYLNFVFIIIGAEMPTRAEQTLGKHNKRNIKKFKKII